MRSHPDISMGVKPISACTPAAHEKFYKPIKALTRLDTITNGQRERASHFTLQMYNVTTPPTFNFMTTPRI